MGRSGTVRTSPSPEARQPGSLLPTESSLCSSALLSAPRGAVSSQVCLEKVSADSTQGRWGEAGRTGSVITRHSPAGFVPCSVFQVLSNQAEQFWSGNPGGELSLLLGTKFCAGAISDSGQCREKAPEN